MDAPGRPGPAPVDAGRGGAPDPRRMRAGLLLALAVGAAAGVAVSVLTGGRATLDAIARLPLGTFIAVVALNLASWAGEAVVFAALAGKKGPRSLPPMVAAYVGGGFPALVTPFGSGGIPGWIWALTREGLSAGEAAAVIGARGLLTSVFFVGAGAVALAVVPARVTGSAGVPLAGFAALLAVLGVVAGVVLKPRVASRALGWVVANRAAVTVLGRARAERAAAAVVTETDRFADGLRSLVRERPWAVAAAACGLVVSRVCLLAIVPVVMSGLGWRGDALPVLGVVVAVWALASASPTPGGTGTVDAAMAVALSAFAPATVAGAAALLWRGATFYFDLLAGWVLFSRYLARSGRP